MRERFDTLIARHGTLLSLPRAIARGSPWWRSCPCWSRSSLRHALAGQLLNKDIDAIVIAGIEESPSNWLDIETTAARRRA